MRFRRRTSMSLDPRPAHQVRTEPYDWVCGWGVAADTRTVKRIIAVAAVVTGLLAVTIPAHVSDDHWLANKTAARAWGDPRYDLVMGSPNAIADGHANVSKFYSYRAFLMSNGTAPIVLYDIEHKRLGVPMREERHPRKFMKAFVAHRTRAGNRRSLPRQVAG